ncbi:hypothetical protein HYW75_03825 [Candidatus Pacearchaeota archaeon]|nr:hypothetical protein [Candidatus Pacearchaeota archaeon]
MAWSSPCGLCSGSYDFRKDPGLRKLYTTIRGDRQKIDELVDFSPCAAIKLYLAYRDQDIGEAFVSRFGDSTERLTNCFRRNKLSWPNCIDQGLSVTPFLANITAMVESSLAERSRDSASTVYGINPLETVFGRENPEYNDFQQLVWILREEDDNKELSLRQRLHIP